VDRKSEGVGLLLRQKFPLVDVARELLSGDVVEQLLRQVGQVDQIKQTRLQVHERLRKAGVSHGLLAFGVHSSAGGRNGLFRHGLLL